MTDRSDEFGFVELNEDRILALSMALKLDETQANELLICVKHIQADLNHHAQFRFGSKERDRVKKRIKRIDKAFAALRRELDKTADEFGTLERLLPNGVGETLGVMLTATALIQSGATPERFRKPDRLITNPVDGNEPMSLERIDEVTAYARSATALASSHTVFPAVMKALHAPFEDWIEAEKKNRGGHPTDLVRNFIIASLIRASQDITGRGPSSSERSRFMKLCRGVLAAFGTTDTGMEQVVSRLIRKAGKKAVPAEAHLSPKPARK
jgi:hypothetical protein